jgi:hypothetical protein
VGTFSVPGLRVKTLDRNGLEDGGTMRRYPLAGVVVGLRLPLVSFWCLRWPVLVLLRFFIYALSFV